MLGLMRCRRYRREGCVRRVRCVRCVRCQRRVVLLTAVTTGAPHLEVRTCLVTVIPRFLLYHHSCAHGKRHRTGRRVCVASIYTLAPITRTDRPKSFSLPPRFSATFRYFFFNIDLRVIINFGESTFFKGKCLTNSRVAFEQNRALFPLPPPSLSLFLRKKARGQRGREREREKKETKVLSFLLEASCKG